VGRDDAVAFLLHVLDVRERFKGLFLELPVDVDPLEPLLHCHSDGFTRHVVVLPKSVQKQFLDNVVPLADNLGQHRVFLVKETDGPFYIVPSQLD